MEEAAPQRDNRAIMAHVLMCVFILFTGLGFALMHLAWGFIAWGVCSAVYGYLLGQNDPVETSDE